MDPILYFYIRSFFLFNTAWILIWSMTTMTHFMVDKKAKKSEYLRISGLSWGIGFSSMLLFMQHYFARFGILSFEIVLGYWVTFTALWPILWATLTELYKEPGHVRNIR